MAIVRDPRLIIFVSTVVGAGSSGTRTLAAEPLMTLEHNVASAQLHVAPTTVYAPKNIPGSFTAEIMTSDGQRRPELAHLAQHTHVEAVLRGPAFPAYRLLGLPNEPLVLPPLALAGEYQVDDIRLVDTSSGETLMLGTPSTVTVHVYPEVLVSRVDSRPLSVEEVQQRGIVIDASNFSAVEFTAAFVVEGRSYSVTMPVVSPKFQESTELLGQAERDARLVEAELINRDLSAGLALPRDLAMPGLDLQVQGLNFQRVLVEESDAPEALRVPSIPGLIVIPGSIGFLNQFFSVQVYTANASPEPSGISVHSLSARLILPEAGTEEAPLRLAFTGDGSQATDTLPIQGTGPDGVAGTTDDEPRLAAGRTGQAEFLIEGRRTGLHLFDVELSGTLDGFAAGEVAIEGHAVGSVLVRNPSFSVVVSHPDTVRNGEPYTAAMTIMNTSEIPAERVAVTLRETSITGAVLLSDSVVELGTIAPGESKTASYHLESRRTGYITFTNLTGEGDMTGHVELAAGVDERGVPLDSRVIRYPHWVTNLPDALRAAADRVLGQALCAATAASLPPGVRRLDADIVERRIIELAEAGQRLRYGDAPERILLDLALDWHGGRTPSLGFDQILRETAAGAELASAWIATLESGSTSSGLTLALARGPDIAGRAEPWGLASSNHPEILPSVRVGVALTETTRPHEVLESTAYGGSQGWIVPARAPTDRAEELEVTFRVPAAHVGGQVAWQTFDGSGSGTLAQLTVVAGQAGDRCYVYAPSSAPAIAIIDEGCDLSSEGDSVSVALTDIEDAPPVVLGAVQDLEVRVARPVNFCFGPTYTLGGRDRTYANYGTLVAVLFSKPLSEASVEQAGAFDLADGTPSNGVELQPGGRVALVNLRNGIADFEAEAPALRYANIRDLRSTHGSSGQVEIETFAGILGVAVRGRVVGTDGLPAADVPVTLTMHDFHQSAGTCVGLDVRPSQVRTDEDGSFHFRYVMAGLAYTVAASDTRGFEPEVVDFLLEAAPEGELETSEVERLLLDSSTRDLVSSLLDVEGAARTQAILETVDRATFRDIVPTDSPRMASTVPVVLRFRGRGTVSGTVLDADGLTPVEGAAVNLFPDRTSRELGRGQYSARDGSFHFSGVPLGPVTVDASTSDGRRRIVAASIDGVGDTTQVEVVLSAASEPAGGMRGTVYDVDGTQPHRRAAVLIRDAAQNTVAAAVTAEDGTFVAERIPAGVVEVLALSYDGRQEGVRRGVHVQPNTTSFVTVLLQGTATVHGQVVTANGSPAVGARVAGGAAVVTTEMDGTFVLDGVPVGRRTLTAGLPPSGDWTATRFGETSIDVVAGTNSATIRLRSVARIHGTVRDAEGQAVPDVRVALPQDGGFFWTLADGAGRYAFENLPLGSYLIAAPSPPVEDAQALVSALRTQDEALILAVLGENETLFTGGITHTQFNPGSYGFTRAELDFDGASVLADITYLHEGTVSGIVLNTSSIPIRAELGFTTVAPAPNGQPTSRYSGPFSNNPITGEFTIPGIRTGPFTVGAASPFYPQPVFVGGDMSGTPPFVVSGLVLQFAASSAGGEITGTVLSDEAPAPSIFVTTSAGHEVTTDPAGRFGTGQAVSPGYYLVTACEQAGCTAGRVGHANVRVPPGRGADVVIPLLSANCAVDVVVVYPDGTPASGATVTGRSARLGAAPDTFPATNASGHTSLSNLFEGSYAVEACHQIDQVTDCSAAATELVPGEPQSVTLILDGSGTITGTYVESDGLTPVGFAQVSIGRVAYATTDGLGQFSATGIPLGTHNVVARNAVTGRAASARVQLLEAGITARVSLREAPLGTVQGHVVDAYSSQAQQGAMVRIDIEDPLFFDVTVTTDPTGFFDLPNIPPGPFTVYATEAGATSPLLGRASGTMPEPPITLTVDVTMEPRADIAVSVLNPDGLTAHAEVCIGAVCNEASASPAEFSRLELRTHRFTARSLEPGYTHRVYAGTLTLDAPGPAPARTITLSDVAALNVDVQPAPNELLPDDIQVVVTQTDPFTQSLVSWQQIASTSGNAAFTNLYPGDTHIAATHGAQGATQNLTLVAGATTPVVLVLSPSGTISGRLVRANGVDTIPNNELVIRYQPSSSAEGAARVRTDAGGSFSFAGVPYGPFTIEGSVLQYDGVAYHEGTLTSTTHDVGDLEIDEEAPMILAVDPPDTSIDVSIDASVIVTFSEPMETSDIDSDAVYLTNGTSSVPSTTLWSTDPSGAQILIIDPSSSLSSQTTYTLFVASGPVIDAQGGIIGRGPTDPARRSLATPFISRFTTRDGTPPTILSASPADGAEQVPPSAVVRIELSEPMALGSVDIELSCTTGAQQSIAGVISQLLDQRVAVFTPASALPTNAACTYTLVAAQDRAGNAAPSLEASFATLDTEGPVIASLAAPGSVIAGAPVAVVATLANPSEVAVQIQLTPNLIQYHYSNAGSLIVPITFDSPGTYNLYARAIDRFGNIGDVYRIPGSSPPNDYPTVTVVPNEPPTMTLTQVTPSSGPLLSGQPYLFRVEATDDLAVSAVEATLSGVIARSESANASVLEVSGTIPADLAVAGTVEVQCSAEDTLGLVQGVSGTFAVEDGVPPTLSAQGPTGGVVAPGTDATVAVQVTDAFGVHTLALDVDPPIADQSVTLAPPQSSYSNSFTFSLPGDFAGDELDVSVTASDGRNTSAQVISVPINRAAAFPQRTDEVVCSAVDLLNGATSATWSYWLHQPVSSPLGRHWRRDNAQSQFYFSESSSGGALSIVLYPSTYATGIALPLGQWTHIAVVYASGASPPDHRLVVYLNGTAAFYSDAVPSALSTEVGIPIRFGGTGSSVHEPAWNGRTDEAAIWAGQAASAQQVAELRLNGLALHDLANAQLSLGAPDLYWTFDAATGGFDPLAGPSYSGPSVTCSGVARAAGVPWGVP